MRRPLKPEEIELNNYSIKRLKEEIVDLELSLEENKLALEEGIDLAYKEQIKNYKKIIQESKKGSYESKLANLKLRIIKNNLPKQKRNYEQLIKEIENKIVFDKNQIDILIQQIKKGVEVKEMKSV